MTTKKPSRGRHASATIKNPKPLAGPYEDVGLFSPAAGLPTPTDSTMDPPVGRRPIPEGLADYLLPDHTPRWRCTHCQTVTAALINYHSDTCSCLCHAARRRDEAKRLERQRRTPAEGTP